MENRMNIHIEKGIRQADNKKIVGWTNARNPEFLCQYAGDKWTFPLSEIQVSKERASIYSILRGREFMGMIQVLVQDRDRIHIGRFLINPDEAGKGIGTAALKSFCKILFEEMKAEAITLNVAETNDAAQKCYQKCGFTVLKKECRNGKNIWKMVLIQ